MENNAKTYTFDPVDAKNKCVQWIRDWFSKNGPYCYAVIGISGGKDSSVVAGLCVEALGKDRVFGVMMPNGTQSDIQDAEELIHFLGIDSITVNINLACRYIKHEIKPQLGDHWSRQSSINLPARMRMVTLYAVSQTIDGRVANTCNYSEDYIGYSTRYGDSVGDFSPLANFTVEEVKLIGEQLGLPNHLIHKTPSDGLCGASDEDNLGFTYQTLDDYLRRGITPPAAEKEKIDQMHVKNLFKLQLMPSFDYWK